MYIFLSLYLYPFHRYRAKYMCIFVLIYKTISIFLYKAF